MHRALATVVLLAGCGRIAFDVAVDADAATSNASDAALVCPQGYTDTAPGCYRAVADPPVEPTWLEAESLCEADGAGAHLAVVSDEAEAERIWALLPDGIDDAFIGATDLVTEGTYLSVTNEAFTYVPWVAGDPDGEVEDCLSLDQSNQILDAHCTDINDYICEYDGISAVPSAWGQ